MSHLIRTFSALILLVALLAACVPAQPETNADQIKTLAAQTVTALEASMTQSAAVNSVQTQAAQTVEALATQNAPLVPTPTHTAPAQLPTITPPTVFIPTATVALHAVDHHDAGVASAMINTSQQVGGSLGTALMNTVAVSATSAFLVANAAQGEAAMPAALTEGFTRGFYVGAGLLLVAAVVVFFMIRIGADAAEEDDEAAPVHIG